MRAAFAVSGTFVLVVAIGGLVLAAQGHPPPSHPYAEITLGLLGVSSVIRVFSADVGSPITRRWLMIVAGLSTVSALAWIASTWLARR